ncbi:sorting nexin-14-like [Prorops nasuta]|uniref:sorting nexin-14-like n=1 Tax=Prorops nasuta TaxID=863751 RepID=UPI0034CD3058
METIAEVYSNNFISLTVALFVFTSSIIIAIFLQCIPWLFFTVCLYLLCSFWGIQIICYTGTLMSNCYIFKNKYMQRDGIKEACTVCKDNLCQRHQVLPQNANVTVPRDFDAALEQLLEELLDTYVCTWYSDLSTNTAFVQQLRLAMTMAIRNIANRALKADTSSLIFDCAIPLMIQHAKDWETLQKKAAAMGGKPQNYIRSYLGPNLHPAAYSHKAELIYLKGVVTSLISHLLPAIHVSSNNKVILREILSNWILSPAMDALSDPDNINTLILLSVNRNNLSSYVTETMNVPMLQSWVTIPSMGHTGYNALKPSLDEILNKPEFLYLFMQHIKESGPVNLLQFCLDIDDLSKRMLDPEMTEEVEQNLYLNVKNLYTAYLDSNSPDYLHLPLHISIGIEKILKGGPEKIQILRTSKPLYEARQEGHALLEAACLSSFHHCYQFYQLLCGQQKLNSRTKPSSQMSVISSSFNMSTKLSSQLNKISGALRASAIDGAPFEPQDVYTAEEVDCTARTYEMDYFSDKCDRDLTTWRITVSIMDSGSSQPLYMVVVHSVAENKSWTVLRRDQDFYTLRSRLTEFHGDKELNDSPLPSRRNPNSSSAANCQRYQDFLQKLLSKPMLRSSELLYTFLTSPNLKPYSNYSTPDIGILYQSMTHKLRKERGQHLDKFMSTFLASTHLKNDCSDLNLDSTIEHSPINELGKVKYSRAENSAPELEFPFNVNEKQVRIRQENIKGACFCFTEAVNKLLSVPTTISRLLWMLACLSRSTMDPFINLIFSRLLIKLLSEGRAAAVIKLLHTKVLHHNNQKKEKPLSSLDRYLAAKEGLHHSLPWWLIFFFAPWCKLVDAILDSLQCGIFNKHLVYYLLDALVINLFPEVVK